MEVNNRMEKGGGVKLRKDVREITGREGAVGN